MVPLHEVERKDEIEPTISAGGPSSIPLPPPLPPLPNPLAPSLPIPRPPEGPLENDLPELMNSVGQLLFDDTDTLVDDCNAVMERLQSQVYNE